LVKKTEEKKTLGKWTPKLDDNIEVDLRQVGWNCFAINSSNSEQGKM